MTIRHDTAGELVDDLDAAVPDDVVDVAAQEDAGMERAVQLGQHRDVLGAVQAAAPEGPLDVLDAGFGQLDVPPVLVGVEVDARQ